MVQRQELPVRRAVPTWALTCYTHNQCWEEDLYKGGIVLNQILFFSEFLIRIFIFILLLTASIIIFEEGEETGEPGENPRGSARHDVLRLFYFHVLINIYEKSLLVARFDVRIQS